MLFERRVYRLLPGGAPQFWDLQRAWNTPAAYRGVLERCVGYFQSNSPECDQIIHLYRYDDYDDWNTRLTQTYTPERSAYFSTARKLVIDQESGFYDLPACHEMSPIWGSDRDWLPGQALFPVDDAECARVVEEVLDFRPGGVASYWEYCRSDPSLESPDLTPNLIGAFSSRVGVLHRVIQYHWFSNPEAAERHVRRAFPGVRKIAGDAGLPLLRGRAIRVLEPSPVPWMRPLFSKVDWSLAASLSKTGIDTHG